MPGKPGISKSAVRAIIIILVAMALLSIYANIQRWRRNSVETVVVTPLETATPSASPTPTPGAAP